MKDFEQSIGWFMGQDDTPLSLRDDWKKSAREDVEQWGPIDELKEVNDKND